MEETTKEETKFIKVFNLKKWDKIFKAILILLIVSIVLNTYYYFDEIKDQSINIQPKDEPKQIQSLSLIDPQIATMDLNDYLQKKQEYTASYLPLREDIEKNILSNTTGHFGVYFEDLDSYSWFGIDERKNFKPASLLKVTTASSILSLVEDGQLLLNTKIKLTEDDLNSRFGDLYSEKDSEYTIKELIEISLKKSDNTATKALHKFITEEKWIETRLAMGIPLVSIEQSEQGTPLSPKDFSKIFHTLYFSGYLSRESSNFILSALSETDFENGIPAGVPKDIKVSHKIGVWGSFGSVHDCGIVYAKKHYLLCIMSENTTEEEGNRVIKEVSEKVYNYVSK